MLNTTTITAKATTTTIAKTEFTDGVVYMISPIQDI